jgi:hypothetical protein
LAVYVVAGHFNEYPNMTPLLYLCPTAIVSMALDHASTSTAVIVWLMISASNAVLYALIPFAIVLIYRVIRPAGWAMAAMTETRGAVRKQRTSNGKCQCGDSSLRSE